jgi:hypothetical protein
VGDAEEDNFTFVRWNGTSWSAVPLTDATNRQDLNSISCLSASDCWAVGDAEGDNFTFVRWNGTSWSALPLNDPVNRQDLVSISCASTIDCWTSGNGGILLRWDGLSWSVHPSGVIQPLHGLFMIPPQNFVRLSDWKEVY